MNEHAQFKKSKNFIFLNFLVFDKFNCTYVNVNYCTLKFENSVKESHIFFLQIFKLQYSQC